MSDTPQRSHSPLPPTQRRPRPTPTRCVCPRPTPTRGSRRRVRASHPTHVTEPHPCWPCVCLTRPRPATETGPAARVKSGPGPCRLQTQEATRQRDSDGHRNPAARANKGAWPTQGCLPAWPCWPCLAHTRVPGPHAHLFDFDTRLPRRSDLCSPAPPHRLFLIGSAAAALQWRLGA